MPPINESTYIGIDPGRSGGIVCLSPGSPGEPGVDAAWPMPATERDLWELVNTLGKVHRPIVARLEFIQTSIWSIDKATMSVLYGNYMQCRMALVAADIRFETVRATDWQKALGIAKRGTDTDSQWGNRLKAKAQELFPHGKRITLATCDAYLIAEYCRRTERSRS